jgi:amidase
VRSLNPALNAVVELYQDAWRPCRSKRSESPFGGIPVLTKDFPVEGGRPAEFGSRLTKGFIASHDKTYWTRLRAGGLVNVGRTTSSEFGVPAATESPLYGATQNPWQLGHGVAGSSGGAGAVVAAGIVPFAQGGDAGGSIRNPAAFCGLIGLKPSRGRVSGSPGAVAPLFGLATAFMLTRSVRDTALLLDLCHGPEAGDGFEIPPPPASYADLIEQRPPRGLRIAFCVEAWSGYPVNGEIAAAVRAIALKLEGLATTSRKRRRCSTMPPSCAPKR